MWDFASKAASACFMRESGSKDDDEGVRGDAVITGRAEAGRGPGRRRLSTTSLLELKRYGECGKAGIDWRDGVAGVVGSGLLFRRCRLRPKGDGNAGKGINLSGRVGVDDESDMTKSDQNNTLF
jgi:hypothetical protein